MKTFDEALQAVIHKTKDLPVKDGFKQQHCFLADIDSSLTVPKLAEDCCTQLITYFIMSGQDADMVGMAKLLHEVFYNGLSFGVSIGVEMEKAE